MNKGGEMSRLALCCLWILFGILTIRAVVKNLSEIQKNLDKPNPVIKKFILDTNK